MDVTILNDRVLVRKKEVETKTSGGIVLTGSAATPTFEATVLKVGEGKRTKNGNLIPLAVKPDDVIIYHPNAGVPMTLDGEQLLVLREDEIFAIKD
jgi:chaperonin GroES